MNTSVLIFRDGQLAQLDPEAFWRWVRTGNLRHSDQVLGSDRVWRRAGDYPDLAPFVPTHHSPDLGPPLFTTALLLVGGLAVYKIGQAIIDEDFGCRYFAQWFRDEVIAEHLVARGSYCPECGRRVRVADLTVDHIVPWARGGLTSRQNAQVMCKRCNSRKRDKVGIIDHVRGRAA